MKPINSTLRNATKLTLIPYSADNIKGKPASFSIFVYNADVPEITSSTDNTLYLNNEEDLNYRGELLCEKPGVYSYIAANKRPGLGIIQLLEMAELLILACILMF